MKARMVFLPLFAGCAGLVLGAGVLRFVWALAGTMTQEPEGRAWLSLLLLSIGMVSAAGTGITLSKGEK